MNSVRPDFLLGFFVISATTGRFPADHHGGFVRGVEGVLPLAWPELWWPEVTGLTGKSSNSEQRACSLVFPIFR